ncbi:hypothetical protein [Priestia megaterium]|uniref:hypothetical protein n=1 Tax=Priestia megaterium TaxID=1404 RepID=UPI002E23E8CB|nr:hypothetical protein [Priestia megaterium]
MTLNEYIDEFKVAAKSAQAILDSQLVSNVSDLERMVERNTDIATLLEELKTLRFIYKERVKNYERLNKGYSKIAEELKTTRKALELACAELERHPYSQWNQQEWHSYYLQKAREEDA